MKALSLATLGVTALLAVAASAQTLDKAAADALGDGGVAAQAKSAGGSISAHSLEMGEVLLQERGGEHGRGGDHGHGDRDRGRGRDRDRERRDDDRLSRQWGRDIDRQRQANGGWYGHPPGGGAPSAPEGHSAHGDWSRWPGHPGWGYYHGWGWTNDRAVWWGWSPYSSGYAYERAQCLGYYDSLQNGCHNACYAENQSCVSNCNQYGPNDYSCKAQCENAYNGCWVQCGADHDALAARCP